MDIFTFTISSEMLNYFIIPLLIFLARVIDVTMGTLRIIFVSKGMKYIAPVIGFFEILVWLMAISQIMYNLTNFFNYFAYAAGFALGTFFGIYLEDRLAMGYTGVILMTNKKPEEIIGKLELSGHDVTVVDMKGGTASKTMIFLIAPRKNIRGMMKIVKEIDPDVFYAIEDVKYMREIHHLPEIKKRIRGTLLSVMSAKKAK